ncbi:MAG: hypothetical protein AAB544_04435, partial [Patescibacteria group bacterium]
ASARRLRSWSAVKAMRCIKLCVGVWVCGCVGVWRCAMLVLEFFRASSTRATKSHHCSRFCRILQRSCHVLRQTSATPWNPRAAGPVHGGFPAV